MNRRRQLELLSAVILAGVAIWIARHTYWDYITVEQPPRGEAARNRYYTFEHLAQKLAIPTRQIATLRTLPPVNGVLVVDDMQGAILRDRIDALKAWVAGGGRLLLSSGALLASPRLQAWTGVGFARPSSDNKEEGSEHATMSDPECAAYSERLAGRETKRIYRACLGASRLAFSSTNTPAWSLSNGYGFQMLRIKIGRGSVAVIECDCLMSNKSLLRADHARVVFDSIPLRRGDQIAILNPVAAESLLALLWRHAAAAVLCALAALGLAIWRNLPRLGPILIPPPPVRRSLAEQIRARARFAWRTRRLASLRSAEYLALTQAARRRLPSYERMDPAERVAVLAAHTGLDLAFLRDALNDNADGGAESQRAAIMLLERARRELEMSLQIRGARV